METLTRRVLEVEQNKTNFCKTQIELKDSHEEFMKDTNSVVESNTKIIVRFLPQVEGEDIVEKVNTLIKVWMRYK